MIITNGILITWDEPNQIIEKQAIYISDNRIVEVGPEAEILESFPDNECLDACGQYIMPGNICAHTHFYGVFARGMAIPGAPPRDFSDILEKLWWPLDKALTHEEIRLSALVMMVDAIKHGTTTLIDHHASPNAIHGSLDVIADTVEQSGIRAILCYEVTDRDGKDKAKEGIAENVRFIGRVNAGDFSNGRVAASFGLHASMTLSGETLDDCCQSVPEDSGFHIHVAEHVVDEYDSLAKSGLRVVDRLHKHGILGPRSIVAHAVHVDAHEINLLAGSGTWVTHQPRSNMNNGVGVAQVESQMRAGVRMCLGTDGFSSTMWEEWKSAYLVHKLWHRDPRRMSAIDVVRMGVYNNAALASSFFQGSELGVIKPGALADLIFVDYKPHTPLTIDNLPWHIVFGFHESMVTTTIVNGKVLMRDRVLLTLDEEPITTLARGLAPGLWKRYEENVKNGLNM